MLTARINERTPPKQYIPEDVCLDDFDAMCAAYARNLQQLKAIDAAAAAEGSVVGRYFRVTAVDGFAYYIVTEDLGVRVRVELARGVDNDTPVPDLGESAVILRSLALSLIEWRDRK